VVVPALASSSPSWLSDAGSIAAIIIALGVFAAVVAWAWRRSRRQRFPDLSIEVTGSGYVTVERVTTVPGAPNAIVKLVTLRRLQAHVTSREPDRNCALTFTLRFRGPDGGEVISAQPQWGLDQAQLDEHLGVLTSPVNVEREHTVSGVLLFAPSLVPTDESVPSEMEIYDHVSRTRVRTPAQIGNYDRRSWTRIGPPTRWERLVAPLRGERQHTSGVAPPTRRVGGAQ
jgi:hypothetical protein